MKIKKRALQKVISVFASVLLLVNSFVPYLFIAPIIRPVSAQEEITPTVEPTSAQTETAVPTVEITPTVEVTPVETITPTEIPTLTPIEASSVPSPPIEEGQIFESEESAKLVVSLWQTNSDGSETTAGVVSLNQTYQAPQNDKVIITFTKLPENPGKLTIKEVKLSADQQEEIGAFSDTAYDITSDMADGTFTYNLTLPIPETAKGKTIEVKSGETVDEVTSNAEVVDEPKEVKSEIITITGLDHFTVFVLVPPITTGVTNGVVTVTDDAFIKEDNTGSNNNGNDIQIESKSPNKDWRGLIKFDLSSIPSDSTVSGAILKLTLTSAPNSSRQHDIHKVTGGWNEGTVTWTSINSSFTASPTDSANTGTTNNQVISWDVTADVNAFLADPASNYGWMIIDSGEEGIANNDYLAKYASSENATNSKRPQLSITFNQENVAGFHNPTAQENVTSSSGDNDGYQTDPTAAFGSDNTYGEDKDSGSQTNDTCASIGADRHLYYNYDLDTQIPTGSTIDGLEVRQDLLVDSVTNSPFTCVELSWDEGTSWTSVEHKQSPTITEATYTFGGSSDKWGRTWSKTDLTNSNFRVRVTNGDINNGNSSRDFDLDWIPVRVYYTEATYTLSYTAGANGSITGTTPQTVNYGADGTTVTAVPDLGYSFTNWSDGVLTASRTDTNVTGNISVTANFADVTVPSTPTAAPPADDYASDQSVTLSSTDSGSGVKDIYYTTDNSDPKDVDGLYRFHYEGAITVDHDMTIKAVAYDNVGNVSDILSATYGIAPLISGETSTFIGTTSTTITWTTDDPSTSRVVYDTVSHSLEAGANYGYANSTVEDSTKVTSHSVGLTGLTAGTTYYYRTVSHGSPEAVSDEKTFATTSTSTTNNGGGTVAGTSTSNPSAPVCNDTKPGNAPVLLSAVAGLNSVTLTWTKASDPVSYYLVTFGTSLGSQTYGNPNVGDNNTTSYTINGLSGGATYYFKVRAGNGCMPGDFSNELSAAPNGGFIAGIPGGFAPGVLGAQDQINPTGVPFGKVTPNLVSNSTGSSPHLGFFQRIWNFILGIFKR